MSHAANWCECWQFMFSFLNFMHAPHKRHAISRVTIPRLILPGAQWGPRWFLLTAMMQWPSHWTRQTVDQRQCHCMHMDSCHHPACFTSEHMRLVKFAAWNHGMQLLADTSVITSCAFLFLHSLQDYYLCNSVYFICISCFCSFTATCFRFLFRPSWEYHRRTLHAGNDIMLMSSVDDICGGDIVQSVLHVLISVNFREFLWPMFMARSLSSSLAHIVMSAISAYHMQAPSISRFLNLSPC